MDLNEVSGVVQLNASAHPWVGDLFAVRIPRELIHRHPTVRQLPHASQRQPRCRRHKLTERAALQLWHLQEYLAQPGDLRRVGGVTVAGADRRDEIGLVPDDSFTAHLRAFKRGCRVSVVT